MFSMSAYNIITIQTKLLDEDDNYFFLVFQYIEDSRGNFVTLSGEVVGRHRGRWSSRFVWYMYKV